ncbi:MAG: hypothetical protein Q8R04_04805 [Nanoarchaeota archaeon]|nr:hypothetical protein [Nanoarchaeota archaeon]
MPERIKPVPQEEKVFLDKLVRRMWQNDDVNAFVELAGRVSACYTNGFDIMEILGYMDEVLKYAKSKQIMPYEDLG